MKDLKRAFGTPDSEFHERVKQTLFQIKEKEEARVKKKLTLSMALAFALCICIVTVSAFAGTELLSGKPDVTQSPFSQGENPGGNAHASSTPLPQETLTPQPSPLPALPTPDPVYVWLAADDSCYHTDRECSALTGVANRALLTVAQSRMQSPCPLCVNTVASTPTPVPTYMPQATQVPGTEAAPNELTYPTPTPMRVDIDNPVVYAVQDRSVFHYVSSLACTDRVGTLTSMPLTDALNEGALPCRECLTCWIGEGSDLYHMSETCSRLNSAQLQLVNTAVQDGYQPCGLCVRFFDLNNAKHHRVAWCSAFGDGVNAYIPCPLSFPYLVGSAPCEECAAGESSPLATSTPIPMADSLTGDEIYLAQDAHDGYVHRTPVCGEIVCVRSYSLKDAFNQLYRPCPDCYGSESFYTINGGAAYHHIDKTCALFLMSSSQSMDVFIREALLLGKLPCEECVLNREEAPASGYYYTADDWYCHADPACINEVDSFIGVASEAELTAMGKRACEDCMEPFSYYYSSSDNYYHTFECAQIAGEQTEALPEDELLALGKRDCPWCLGWYNYYSSAEDGCYHKTSSCDQHFGTATFHNAEAELIEMGKKPCPVCIASDAETLPEPADEPVRVFSTPNGTFYHTVSNCSGMKNAESIVLAEALNRSQTACPVCTAEVNQSIDIFIVYLWDSNAPVYHSLFDCSGFEYRAQMGIDEAAAQEKIPCPECVNTDNTVWYTQDSEYYHSYQHYAYLDPKTVCGSNPTDALAAGKRPCENCMLTETAKTATSSVTGQLPPAWSTGGSKCFFYDYSQDHSGAMHFSADCEAMESPVAISLETAAEYDLWHCDLCSEDYYRHDCIVQKDDTVYHLSDTCGEFFGADRITRWDALLRGLEPCPDCAWEDISRTAPLPTVPPQPTMPPSDNQDALKAWLPSESEQAKCLADLGVSLN